jgi:hypothetical protein
LGAPATALAEAVSLAIGIEPQPLRKMRLELFPAADSGFEADLWFSPAVELIAGPIGLTERPLICSVPFPRPIMVCWYFEATSQKPQIDSRSL